MSFVNLKSPLLALYILGGTILRLFSSLVILTTPILVRAKSKINLTVLAASSSIIRWFLSFGSFYIHMEVEQPYTYLFALKVF